MSEPTLAEVIREAAARWNDANGDGDFPTCGRTEYGTATSAAVAALLRAREGA